MAAVVEVEGLVKQYGDQLAVDHVSLRIEEGEIFALLGPNGAGKSTTIEILEGHRAQTGGTVSVLGQDPRTAGRSFRDRIGIVLQTSGIEQELTVSEVLEVYRRSYRKPLLVDEVLDLVGLTAQADQRIATLSGGQRRRIDLGLGLIGDPDLIFLDEPTTGFDPSARRRAWSIIDGLRTTGKTVLLTTHYLDEAQHLADRVAVMMNGRIVVKGTPESLIAGTGQTLIRFHLANGVSAKDVPGLSSGAVVTGHEVELSTDAPTVVLAELTNWAIAAGQELGGLTVTRPTLEDVFLKLTATTEPGHGE